MAWIISYSMNLILCTDACACRQRESQTLMIQQCAPNEAAALGIAVSNFCDVPADLFSYLLLQEPNESSLCVCNCHSHRRAGDRAIKDSMLSDCVTTALAECGSTLRNYVSRPRFHGELTAPTTATTDDDLQTIYGQADSSIAWANLMLTIYGELNHLVPPMMKRSQSNTAYGLIWANLMLTIYGELTHLSHTHTTYLCWGDAFNVRD